MEIHVLITLEITEVVERGKSIKYKDLSTAFQAFLH